MSKLARRLSATMTLLLALLMTSNAPARYFDEIVDAQKDLARLAKLYADAQGGSGKVDSAKVKEMTEAMKRKYEDLSIIKAIYKPTKTRGIGYNPARKGVGDGIEKRIDELAKKELTKSQLAEEKALLLRMASYNLAIHDVNKVFTPTNPRFANVTRLWGEYNAELKQGTEEAIQAVTANDPGALKKASRRIVGSCFDCHLMFVPPPPPLPPPPLKKAPIKPAKEKESSDRR